MLPMYEIRKTDLTVKRNNYELSFPEHMHKYLEIAYAYKGVQHIKIEDREYALTEGNLAVIFPDTLHSYFTLDKTDAPMRQADEREILILMCSPALFGGLFPNFKNFAPENPIIEANRIGEKFKIALDCISPKESFEVTFSWTCVIVSYLMNELKVKSLPAQPVENITYKIIKYVEENFTEPITRESLAKKFNVSESYISRVFTQKFKMGLRKYLGLARIEYAANLIRTTDESFTAVSQLAGFDSQRTFNRMFKAVYGRTPREYRNNINSFMKE